MKIGYSYRGEESFILVEVSIILIVVASLVGLYFYLF